MKLHRGLNFGGYLSQCKHTKEHYSSFIGEADVRQVSEWGFDHIRLPIDYLVLETDEGEVKPEGYELVSKVISWCEKYNLDIILDLHKAYGYDFNDAGNDQKNNLFTSEELKQRFINLWKNIAETYGGHSNVAFELLNEVVEEKNTQSWNELIGKTVAAIREITKDTPIIYGGIMWNSASTLKYLEIPKDDNIIFTFHFYEPLAFTHQKAHWVKTIDQSKVMHYPETMEYYKENSGPIGIQGLSVVEAKSRTMGIEFIQEKFAEAVEAAKNAGVSLYCGEFGVIDKAPIEDTYRWFEDVDKVFRQYDIGCAVWTYKRMDFGLVDSHYDDIRERLISLWVGKN